jgi:hypothetical protein
LDRLWSLAAILLYQITPFHDSQQPCGSRASPPQDFLPDFTVFTFRERVQWFFEWSATLA